MEQTATRMVLEQVELAGDLMVPDRARGLVVFAHGSGSSRHSPRNRRVAGTLNRGGLGTLLTDLLTVEEEEIDRQTNELRFAVHLLARRLEAITQWVLGQPELRDLAIGYFGASTGSAVALVAASERPDVVKAVVSRGGRPDLAGSALSSVRAPCLFIVGSDDTGVLSLNYTAAAQLPRETERRIEIIEGAGHLFEEPGTLEEVAMSARQWFSERLIKP
jgi:putative phosphoribosyl transferase